MSTPPNILWIMCDQLRFDYLSCYGHKTLHTPHIDALAAQGVTFTNAYVQSPVCGPSRMSYYTGRYMRSHGSTWNQFPLRVGEPTLGDHLQQHGIRNVLIGKTHMKADLDGMAQLDIPPDSRLGVHISQCGFEPYERDDGLHPSTKPTRPRYDAYLKQQGFEDENPWQSWANSGLDDDDVLANGWFLKNSVYPARVPEEHSETAYMTNRAMDFMREAKTQSAPWVCHLSYIKPHWPYVVPAPYHDYYRVDDIQSPVRNEAERQDPHPVYAAFMQHQASQSFRRDETREAVIPAYMGLIKQIDDHIGRLLAFLDEEGLRDNTLIVFTSDHGDYLGDHWLGEKDLFHQPSVKVPLIIADPRPAADATRGSTQDALVEAIDLAPTFLDSFGITPPDHIMEGRSLMPWLQGKPPQQWRKYAISEYDYSMQEARKTLNQPIKDCRLFMVFDGRWKYIHAPGFRPMLYDLKNDPDELNDLGADATYQPQIVQMKAHLLDWSLQHHTRITTPDSAIEAYDLLSSGILIGYWDEKEIPT